MIKTFTLGTLLWTITVGAVCFAAYRYDVRLAPAVASLYAVYFLCGVKPVAGDRLRRYVRVGATAASVGVVGWLAIALLLDWIVQLQSGSHVDVQMVAMMFLVSVGMLFAYGIFGAIIGGLYGVVAYAIPRTGARRTDSGS